MKQCWAHSIGGCGGLSREHIVSDAILRETVTVQGFPWCKEKPTKIPSASFKSWILCDRHNNALSPADSEIKNFVFSFKTYFQNSMAYDANPLQFARLPIRYCISGTLLERWFCKTLVNVATLVSSDAEIRTESVLPFLFQDRRFSRPYGLNFAVRTGQVIQSQDDCIAISPIFHTEANQQRLVVGGLFVFRGFHFIVLLPTSLNPIRNGTLPLDTGHQEWDGMHLNWHNREITETKRGRSMNVLFQVVQFLWD
jgi:hypothetical protein